MDSLSFRDRNIRIMNGPLNGVIGHFDYKENDFNKPVYNTNITRK